MHYYCANIANPVDFCYFCYANMNPAVMKKLCLSLLIVVAMMAVACKPGFQTGFVRVQNGAFHRNGGVYQYNGTNMWYAAILGSRGQGGNRERLCRELDTLCARGIMNIRALAGGSEGVQDKPSHTWPVLQPEAGVYNDTILEGLDFFVAELEKRGMTCVLYLNNSWDWSGGFGTYLEWAGAGDAPDGSKDWDAFQKYHSNFTRNRRAMELAANHTRFMVSRTNSITGKPYSESPAIMAWEICNEPRPFTQYSGISEDEKLLVWDSFAEWIGAQARLIKSIDRNHLVTTGSEGFYGCAQDSGLLVRIHSFPEIDYCCIHCWPNNWGWCGPAIAETANCKERNGVSAPQDMLENAIRRSEWYIDMNMRILSVLGKPVVLEEYGYPRDNYEIRPGSPVTARKRYYDYIATWIGNTETTGSKKAKLAGANFWGWGGEAVPIADRWHKWAPYTADPAQEEQGLYSVFVIDRMN